LFASSEGLLLDPVYTGRAAAGLLDLVCKGFFETTETVLFLHTPADNRRCSRSSMLMHLKESRVYWSKNLNKILD
jgi:hypothetical protein